MNFSVLSHNISRRVNYNRLTISIQHYSDQSRYVYFWMETHSIVYLWLRGSSNMLLRDGASYQPHPVLFRQATQHRRGWTYQHQDIKRSFNNTLTHTHAVTNFPHTLTHSLNPTYTHLSTHPAPLPPQAHSPHTPQTRQCCRDSSSTQARLLDWPWGARRTTRQPVQKTGWRPCPRPLPSGTRRCAASGPRMRMMMPSGAIKWEVGK
jgi:hypothetical protein